MTEACRDLLGVAPTAATWRRHTQRYLSVNSGIKVFKKCTLSHFYRSFVCCDFVSKVHSLLDFGLNHFFYIFKHHIQHYSETSTVLNTHQPINQAPKDNRRKHESKSSIVLLSWDTQTQQHERHDSLSAGRLLHMDQLTQVHTCLCVSCTQWPPHIALPLNRNKTVTNTSAVSPVWPAGHSPEAELLTQDGFKKNEKQKLKSTLHVLIWICIYLAEWIFTLLQMSHISSGFDSELNQKCFNWFK